MRDVHHKERVCCSGQEWTCLLLCRDSGSKLASLVGSDANPITVGGTGKVNCLCEISYSAREIQRDEGVVPQERVAILQALHFQITRSNSCIPK